MGGSRQTNGISPNGVGLGQMSSPMAMQQFGLSRTQPMTPSPQAGALSVLSGGAAAPFGAPNAQASTPMSPTQPAATATPQSAWNDALAQLSAQLGVPINVDHIDPRLRGGGSPYESV